MSVPKNLTCAEVGALLVVVGQRMMDHGVAADVVLQLDTYTDPDETLGELIRELQDAEPYDAIDDDRAAEILRLTLEEAIDFNPANPEQIYD